MVMRAKYEITVYDCCLKHYEFTIKSNENVEILYLSNDSVKINVHNRDRYISYKQFKNGLQEE